MLAPGIFMEEVCIGQVFTELLEITTQSAILDYNGAQEYDQFCLGGGVIAILEQVAQQWYACQEGNLGSILVDRFLYESTHYSGLSAFNLDDGFHFAGLNFRNSV